MLFFLKKYFFVITVSFSLTLNPVLMQSANAGFGAKIGKLQGTYVSKSQYSLDPTLKVIRDVLNNGGSNTDRFNLELARQISTTLVIQLYLNSNDMFVKDGIEKFTNYILNNKKAPIHTIVKNFNADVITRLKAKRFVTGLDDIKSILKDYSDDIKDIISVEKISNMNDFMNAIDESPELTRYFNTIKKNIGSDIAKTSSRMATNIASLTSILIFDIVSLALSIKTMVDAVKSGNDLAISAAALGIIGTVVSIVTTVATIATGVLAISAAGGVFATIVGLVALFVTLAAARTDKVDNFKNQINAVLASKFRNFYVLAEPLISGDYDIVYSTNNILNQDYYRVGLRSLADGRSTTYPDGMFFSGLDSYLSYPKTSENILYQKGNMNIITGADYEDNKLIEAINNTLKSYANLDYDIIVKSTDCAPSNPITDICQKKGVVVYEENLLHFGYASSRNFENIEVDIGAGYGGVDGIYDTFAAGIDLLKAVKKSNIQDVRSVMYNIDGRDVLDRSNNDLNIELRVRTFNGDDFIALNNYNSNGNIEIKTGEGNDVIAIGGNVGVNDVGSSYSEFILDAGDGYEDVLSLLYYVPFDNSNKLEKVSLDGSNDNINAIGFEHIIMPLFSDMEFEIKPSLPGNNISWGSYVEGYLTCDEDSYVNRTINKLLEIDIGKDGSNNVLDINEAIKATFIGGGNNAETTKLCRANPIFPIVSTIRSLNMTESNSYYQVFNEIRNRNSVSNTEEDSLNSHHIYTIKLSQFSDDSNSTFRLKVANPNTTLKIFGDNLTYEYYSRSKHFVVKDNRRKTSVNLNVGSADLNLEVYNENGVLQNKHLIDLNYDFLEKTLLSLEGLSDDERYIVLDNGNHFGLAPINPVLYDPGYNSCVVKKGGSFQTQKIMMLTERLVSSPRMDCVIGAQQLERERGILVVPDTLLKYKIALEYNDERTRFGYGRRLVIDDDKYIHLKNIYKIVDSMGKNLFNSSLTTNEETLKLDDKSVGDINLAHYAKLSYNDFFTESNGGHSIGNVHSAYSAIEKRIVFNVDLWDAVGADSWNEFIKKISKYNAIDLSLNVGVSKNTLEEDGITNMPITIKGRVSTGGYDEEHGHISGRVGFWESITQDVYSDIINSPEATISSSLSISNKRLDFRYYTFYVVLDGLFNKKYSYWLNDNALIFSKIKAKFSRSTDYPTTKPTTRVTRYERYWAFADPLTSNYFINKAYGYLKTNGSSYNREFNLSVDEFRSGLKSWDMLNYDDYIAIKNSSFPDEICLDVKYGWRSENQPIVGYQCITRGNQPDNNRLWRFLRQGNEADPWFKIVAKHSNMCLAVINQNNLVQKTCDENNDAMYWKRIASRDRSKVVEDEGNFDRLRVTYPFIRGPQSW